ATLARHSAVPHHLRFSHTEASFSTALLRGAWKTRYDAAVPILRVATLNIWGRQGPWEARRAVLRRQLAELEVDVIGLQEVLRFDPAQASGSEAPVAAAQDQALEIASGLGFE